MHLLIITPEFPPLSAGGLLKYYDVMTAEWVAAGARVTVLVANPFASYADYDRDGLAVRFAPLDRVNWNADRLTHLAAAPIYRRWIASGLAAREWVSRHGDDVDLIETSDFGLLFAPILTMSDRPPVVVTLHGSIGQIGSHEPARPAEELDQSLARLTEAVCLSHVDGLHAYSPMNGGEWTSALGRSVTVLPPAVAIPPAIGPHDSIDFSALVVGRIQAWKGPELLCKACRLLGSDASRVRIAWVGRDTNSGPAGQSMSGWLAERYPDVWGHRVVPIGQRSSEEVAALQSGIGIAVVPSLWDTFNFTLAEAMGVGCVTLGSTGAGASHLIHDRVSGWRFSPDDPAALAECLAAAHAMTPVARAEMGAAARETIARELAPPIAAARVMDAFRTIARGGRTSALPPAAMSFFEPGATRQVGSDFLENVSMRELTRHLLGRLSRKFRK